MLNKFQFQPQSVLNLFLFFFGDFSLSVLIKFVLIFLKSVYYFYYKSCKCYNIVILETDRALFLFLRGFKVIVVEEVLGGGAIIFYLLF